VLAKLVFHPLFSLSFKLFSGLFPKVQSRIFSLLAVDECELFFRALIDDSHYFYPPTNLTAKGIQWKQKQCSPYINFEDGTQPPEMRYCVCCDLEDEDDQANTCPMEPIITPPTKQVSLTEP
jgi:hypothetical protein